MDSRYQEMVLARKLTSGYLSLIHIWLICLKCFTEISLSVTAMLASIFGTKLLQMMQLSLHQFLGLASMRLTLLKIILITASLMACLLYTSYI